MSMTIRETELIGQLLIQKGFITIARLEEALREQKNSGGFIGANLVRLGFISEDNLYSVLSEQFDVPYVKLKNIRISPSAIETIPAKFVTHYKLIPIDFEHGTITIATSDTSDIHTLDDLKLLLSKDIRTVLASEGDIIEAIKKYYGVGAETIEKMGVDVMQKRPVSIQGQKTQDIIDSAEDASIIKFVNQLLLEAYKERATDVHIEPYEDEVRVRYRIDSVLHDTKVPLEIKHYQSAIISRVKIMANLNIAERRLPQDGRIKIRIDDNDVDVRVSVLPTPFGESVVIRLLSTNIRFGLTSLGFLKKDLELFERMIEKPHGIIFVTGPTGSGKTTTLYAALSKLNSRERKILTLEDPIEYQLKGITQIQVHPKIDLTFANGLRSMLRHDPDIMMVGEVRDFETAEITIRIALTGHLVFSTLHTNDAAGCIIRLLDMGVEAFLVSSSVECFIAQRLVRIVCGKCKKEVKPDKDALRRLEVMDQELSNVAIYQGKGCEFCRYTGYRGRTAIYEILPVSEPIKELIVKRASAYQIKKKALSLGMRTLRQDGWEKVTMGITTPSEVLRVTQQEDASGA